jgi:extradiol dioxygenase family protein
LPVVPPPGDLGVHQGSVEAERLARAGDGANPIGMSLRPFHLAFPVRDLLEARAFYGGLLGCPEGRSSDEWIDFDFFGHQIVAHLAPASSQGAAVNHVDGHGVPVPHFGVVLTLEAFDTLAERLKAAGVRFEIEPYTRFKGEPGEQSTMFFRDPSGNAIEMKAFASLDGLFAT